MKSAWSAIRAIIRYKTEAVMNTYKSGKTGSMKKIAADIFNINLITDSSKSKEFFESKMEQIIDFELRYF